MQNRTHPGERRAVQIVQARTTRDRIRCNTTQCRTSGLSTAAPPPAETGAARYAPSTPPSRGCSCPHRPFETFAGLPLARTRGFQGFNLFRA